MRSNGTKGLNRQSKATRRSRTGSPALRNCSRRRKKMPTRSKAYRRAAARIRTLAESLDRMVREGDDLTRFPGIGEGIAAAIREIVLTGSLGKLETLRGQATPALAGHQRLCPPRPQARDADLQKAGHRLRGGTERQLESGEIEKLFGLRMAQHVRQGLTEMHVMLLYQADDLRDTIEAFLIGPCGARRVEAAGDYRRRVEVIDELVFLVEADDFAAVVARLQRYGGRTPLLSSDTDKALFALSSGIRLRLQRAAEKNWGFHMVACTGAKPHLRKLTAVAGPLRQLNPDSFPTEGAFYREFGLAWIEPELREGQDEVRQAKTGLLPDLVTLADLRGDLHAHTVSSDGSDSIEDDGGGGAGTRLRLYRHHRPFPEPEDRARRVGRGPYGRRSGLSTSSMAKLRDFHILKSSEVDILADGRSDYPDDLLEELDYTVCSIHSRFACRSGSANRAHPPRDGQPPFQYPRPCDRTAAAEATWLRDRHRPDYRPCPAERMFFRDQFEPRPAGSLGGVCPARRGGGRHDRDLDRLSQHGEFGLIRCGLDQARRAGLERSSILNCRSWRELQPLFKR